MRASPRTLTKREIEVVRLLANGNQYDEVADILRISPHTVHSTLKTIRVKLDTVNTAATIAEAMREGYIQ